MMTASHHSLPDIDRMCGIAVLVYSCETDELALLKHKVLASQDRDACA